MAFVGVYISRTEKNGEQRHTGGDDKCTQRYVDLADNGLVTAGYRLQLQRDIGRRRQQRHQRHHHRDARTLAVAGRDQIGNRCNAMNFADAHNFAQQPPPADEYQGRTQVNGDELETIAGSRADRAVKSP